MQTVRVVCEDCELVPTARLNVLSNQVYDSMSSVRIRPAPKIVVRMVSSVPTRSTNGMLKRLVLQVASSEMNWPYFLKDASMRPETYIKRITVPASKSHSISNQSSISACGPRLFNKNEISERTCPVCCVNPARTRAHCTMFLKCPGLHCTFGKVKSNNWRTTHT